MTERISRCKAGDLAGSFRPDGVLWLASRQEAEQQFDEEYLEKNDREKLQALRIVAGIAAILCVTLRLWGNAADWPA